MQVVYHTSPPNGGGAGEQIEVEAAEKLVERDGLALRSPAAPVRQKPEEAFRGHARFAEGRDARVAMSLGEAETVRSAHERDVKE